MDWDRRSGGISVNSTRATVPTDTHREAAVRAREEARVLGARNVGHGGGALPMAGKREEIFF